MNKRVTIEMPDEMHRLIAEYAAEAGAEPNAYMMEVLEQHLEDLQDIALAEAAMEHIQNGEPTCSLADVKARLGLDD